MRYVPNLIPDKSRILKDYFKGDLYQRQQNNTVLAILGWVSGVVFLIGAIASIIHPLLALVFGLLGFVLLPPGHLWLEKNFRFRFTTKAKSVFVAILFATTLPLISYYGKIDQKEAYQLKIKTEQEQREKNEAEKKDQQRRDSFNLHIAVTQKLENQHKVDEALKQLNYASHFASSDAQKDFITKERINVSAIKAFDLVKAGKYKAALAELNILIEQDGSNADLLYNRALCLGKTGKIREAVKDCKSAIDLGNNAAVKLHEKINPIRRHVAYYVTRCCDGTTSSATGRGACSHHGGVCNWNDPVYEETRKYE